ncbi:MAG: hypothetical protein HRF42_03895 [Candidatus Brocadia sp.]|jgi:ASC-1-like (ASCH) protein
MYWKKICIPLIVAIVTSFFSMQNEAFSSDVYFTPQEIKGQILHAIEGCRESLDIAVRDITSRDIINALVKAGERGVHIRIVIDRKRSLTKGPLSRLYKNKDFAIKTLVQKGQMYSNFAIFDSKLLATGSYCWSGDAGRFNRYNTIFTDETRLLVKYQREFDRLFHEGIATGVKEKEDATEAGKPPSTTTEAPVTGTRVIASNFGIIITETPNGYINMGFEEFNNIFGMTSELSDDQKEHLWSQCMGRKVRWSGKVTYIGWGLTTGWMMSVSHGDTSVEIKLNPLHKDRFSLVKYGNTVTYTGKLDSRVTKIFPYKLVDGDIYNIQNGTSASIKNTDELFEYPDVVPVSQGPKKIFLIESFEDLDKIFGKESNLSDAQKDKAWEKYKGKYVSWMGQIVHKNLNVASGLRVMMMQKERCDVELKFGLAKKEMVLKFQDGETILYTGKLVERCGSLSPYVLDDGDIITMKESNTGLSGM